MMAQNNKAFTLIELLAIVFVTLLMTATIFANYGTGSESFALERSGQKLAQDFRRVQEMSLSGFEGQSSTEGYGIYFNTSSPTQYLVYMNNDTDLAYSSGTDTIKETVKIESGIQICSLLDNISYVDNLSISFEPPEPLTYIGSNYYGHEGFVRLCITNNSSITRTVKVNNAGRVGVSNP
jgi:type II secretory pathway pseudopilin PulG